MQSAVTQFFPDADSKCCCSTAGHSLWLWTTKDTVLGSYTGFGLPSIWPIAGGVLQEMAHREMAQQGLGCNWELGQQWPGAHSDRNCRVLCLYTAVSCSSGSCKICSAFAVKDPNLEPYSLGPREAGEKEKGKKKPRLRESNLWPCASLIKLITHSCSSKGHIISEITANKHLNG